MHGARMLMLGGVALLAGCGGGGAGAQRASFDDALPARLDEPIGVQMMRTQPQLRTQRFANLVSFEASSDTVFITPAGGTIQRDNLRAHTGRSSLRCEANELRAKLSSLVPLDSFPGKWTLLGGYVYAPEGATITIGCQIGTALVAQRKLGIPPRRWTPAMLDVTLLGEVPGLVDAGSTSEMIVRFDSPQPIWLDDLMLIDNAQTLFAPADSPGPDDGSLTSPWTIRRRGLHYIVTAPGRFETKLLTSESSGAAGWEPRETQLLRARFVSEGREKSLTLYPDGRAYWDGRYRPLSAAAAEPPHLQQHLSPATLEVSEEFGRVDRDTDGDADNDGYNESRGAYQIRAIGPRLEVVFTPRTPTVIRPVFEITGMPPGKAIVTIEGRLVEDHVRLDDGTLLIDIPARVNRSTTINVKVQ